MEMCLRLFAPVSARHKDSANQRKKATHRAIEKYGPATIAKSCNLIMKSDVESLAVLCMIDFLNDSSLLRHGFLEDGVYRTYMIRVWGWLNGKRNDGVPRDMYRDLGFATR